MRAIEVVRFGSPDVLELREPPDPIAGPGQVLVAASACDVLFVDTMIRSGRGAEYFPIRPCHVSDFLGQMNPQTIILRLPW